MYLHIRIYIIHTTVYVYIHTLHQMYKDQQKNENFVKSNQLGNMKFIFHDLHFSCYMYVRKQLNIHITSFF